MTDDPTSDSSQSGIDKNDIISDVYDLDTKNIPGYDSHRRWIGMQAWLDNIAHTRTKSTTSTGHTKKSNKRKGINPMGSKHKRGMPSHKKPEPNWSFKQNKSESSMVKKKVTLGSLVAKGDMAARISGKPKKQETHDRKQHMDESREEIIYDDDYATIKYIPAKYVKIRHTKRANYIKVEDEPDECQQPTKRMPVLHKRKPTPNLLRDTSKDTHGVCGVKNNSKPSFISKKKKTWNL